MLSRLYRYESVKSIKNFVRPAKHFVCGKNGIYEAIDQVIYHFAHRPESVRTVFDIGAAHGEYAVHFLKSFPNATVYCFEPVAASFEILRRRVARYGDRVKLYNFGLFNHSGTEIIHETPHGDSSSFFDRKIPHAVARSIPVRSLDDFVREEKIAAIDFCKIDVEGAELEVLKGGVDTFANRIRLAYIEIEPGLKGHASDDYIKVFQAMHDYGFGLRGALDTSDYFFFKRSSPHHKKEAI